MRQENLYYKTQYQRGNPAKAFFLSLFVGYGYFMSIPIEILLRKNQGERHFSLFWTSVIIFWMIMLPIGVDVIRMMAMSHHRTFDVVPLLSEMILQYPLWYGFVGLLIWQANKRRKEVVKSRSAFDFHRFSRYSGDVNPRFFDVPLFGKTPTIRQVETIIEPGCVLVVGLVLIPFGIMAGYLLVVCSLIYSLSYMGRYAQADNQILDGIDSLICDEAMALDVVAGRYGNEKLGFRFMGDLPNDPALRRRVVGSMLSDDAEAIAA